MEEQKSLKIRKGQSIPLIFDKAAKFVFGRDNVDLATILVSALLEIPYEDLIGKITYLPLNYPGENKTDSSIESDLVLIVKTPNGEERLIIEFNYFHYDLESKLKNKQIKLVLNKTKQGKSDQTLGYLCKLYSSIKVGEKFKDVSPVTLINFNSFGTFDNKFSNYGILNYNNTLDIYSEKLKIRNINVAKCYQEWYNGKYQERNINEHNLFILSVMMATDKLDEVYKLIEELEIDSSLKKRFRKVVNMMNTSIDLTGLYYNYDERQKALDDYIKESVREEFAKENFEKGEKRGLKIGEKRGEQRGLKIGEQRGEANKEKEMVINMYKDNALIEKICKYANLPIKKVNKIIEDYKRNHE